MGSLAKALHTPITVFEDMNDVQLLAWVKTVEEMHKREEKAIKEHHRNQTQGPRGRTL